MKTRFFLIICIFLIIASALPAAAGIKFAKMNGVALRVGKTDVSLDRFDKAVKAARVELTKKHIDEGSSTTSFEGAVIGNEGASIEATVLFQLIDSAIVEENARKEKVIVKEALVNKRMNELKAKFPSSYDFHRSIAEQGMSVDDVKGNIRRQLLEEGLKKIVASNVVVPDEDIKAFYDHNIEMFYQPKKIALKQIIVKDENLANDLLASLEGGADFSSLAQAYSEDPATRDKGGDLGLVKPEDLDPAIEHAALALKPGEASDVISLDDGFHIISVAGIEKGKETSLAEAKENIRIFLQKEKSLDAFSKWLDEQRQAMDVIVNEKLKKFISPSEEKNMTYPDEISPSFSRELG